MLSGYLMEPAYQQLADQYPLKPLFSLLMFNVYNGYHGYGYGCEKTSAKNLFCETERVFKYFTWYHT